MSCRILWWFGSFLLFTGGVFSLDFINQTSNLQVKVGDNAVFIWKYKLTDEASLEEVIIGYKESLVSYKVLAIKRNGADLQKNPSEQWFADHAVYEIVDVSFVKLTIPIRNPSTFDNAMFECSVEADGSKKTTGITLAIINPPTFSTKPLPTKIIDENLQLSLSCATVAKPDATVSWYKDNKLLSEEEKINNVEFTAIKRTDSGNYTCVASNIAGTVMHSVIVTVQYKPVINTTLTTSEIGSFVGNVKPVHLHCVASGLPPPKYTWQNSRGNEVGSNGVYILVNPTNDQFGKYICEASNKLGVARHELEVKKISVPDPVNIGIIDVKSRSAVINIILPPASGFGNSQLKAMKLSYRPMNSANTEQYEIEKNLNRYNLAFLLPFTEYELNVTILNQAFESKGQRKIFKTAEEAPGLTNLKVKALSPYTVNVTWTPPTSPNGIITKYTMKFYNKSFTFDEAPFVAVQLDSFFKVFSKLEPYTLYVTAIQASNSAGDGEWSTIEKFTDPLEPGAPKNVTVDIINSKRISVSWNTPKILQSGYITKVHLILNCTSKENLQRKSNPIIADATDTRLVLITTMLPYSDCYLILREGAGDKPTWGKFSDPYFFIMPEGAPDPIRNFAIIGNHNAILDLRWDPPAQINGILSKFTIEFKNSTGIYRESLSLQLDNKTFYYSLKNLKEAITYNISIYAHTKYQTSLESQIFTERVNTALPVAGGHKHSSDTSAIIAGVFTVLVLFVLALLLFLYIARKKKMRLKNLALKNTGNGFTKLQHSPSYNAYSLEPSRNGYSSEKSHSITSIPPINYLPSDYVKNAKCIFTPVRPIQITSLKDFVQKNHSNKDKGFIDEFRAIKPEGDFTYEISNKAENKCKNRYANILAYDHSRVVLNTVENLEGSDYVNANYIDGYNKKAKFIATQGPVTAAFNDFWRMIWEQNTTTIIMVTNLVERSRIKCQKYWPSHAEKVQVQGNIHIYAQEEIELADYVVRRFKIVLMKGNVEEGARQVTQYQFLSWPDHGVPQFATPLIQFVRRLRSFSDENAGPTVIHCSAGVGRTGTYITLDAMMDQIEAESAVDILGFVTQIRTQRNLMVQTEGQYVFLFNALLEYVLCGNTEVNTCDLPLKIKHLNSLNPSSTQTYMQEEFERLNMNMDDSNKYMTAMLPFNKPKNRFTETLPYELTRVKLWPYPNTEGSDYINASFIDGYQQREAYILTQAPLENTIQDFWRMLWEYEVFSVVMISSPKERDMHHCYPYWPVNNEATLFGLLSVQISAEEEKVGYIRREFRVTNTKTGESRVVSHFMYFDWSNESVPDTSQVIDMIGQLQKAQQQTGNSIIVMHCSDGSGRSGSLAAVMYCLERLKLEGVVDVFQTVRAMRTQRPSLVQTLEQYQFIYKTVRNFLDCFSDYANFK